MDRAAIVYARPDPTSFDWAQFPRSLMVAIEGHHANGFTQVIYIEPDHEPDPLGSSSPTFTTYQITGWVEDDALTDRQIRHFYVLNFSGETPECWPVQTDHHVFTLFWAPLDNLPDIVYPQNIWLDVLNTYDNS